MDLANWRNNQFRQVSREYGDYLYFQDREMFNVVLEDALAGKGDNASFAKLLADLKNEQQDGQDWQPWAEDARAAIAKAKGEA